MIIYKHKNAFNLLFLFPFIFFALPLSLCRSFLSIFICSRNRFEFCGARCRHWNTHRHTATTIGILLWICFSGCSVFIFRRRFCCFVAFYQLFLCDSTIYLLPFKVLTEKKKRQKKNSNEPKQQETKSNRHWNNRMHLASVCLNLETKFKEKNEKKKKQNFDFSTKIVTMKTKQNQNRFRFIVFYCRRSRFRSEKRIKANEIRWNRRNPFIRWDETNRNCGSRYSWPRSPIHRSMLCVCVCVNVFVDMRLFELALWLTLMTIQNGRT